MATARAHLTSSFTGAVLCGGQSRRMGRDKATLVVDGTPMAARVAQALRRAGAAQVLAVGGPTAALTAMGLEVVPDDEPGAGPFPATLTALRHADTELVAVLSCDLLAPSPPAITRTVTALADAPGGVIGAVPLVAGVLQWTHAAWRQAARRHLEAARAAGARSLARAGAGLPILQVDGLSESSVADADEPGDLPSAR